MKYVISERQYELICEQSMTGWGKYVPKGQHMDVVKGMDAKFGHDLNNVLGLASIFIPVIGPIVAAGTAAADVSLYWKQGDKKTASIVAAFSFLPFARIGKLVPSVGKLGKEGMEELAKKIGQNAKEFTAIEKEVIDQLSKNKQVLSQEVKRVSDDLAKKSQNLKAKATQGILRLAPNPDWIYRWFSNNTGGMIKNLFEKINKLDKIPFNPENVKIVNNGVLDSVEKGVFKQRPIIEIQVKETGDRFLVYSSTGTGAPTLKQAGDWQLLAGFQPMVNNPKDIRWYLKDEATTQLTKGLNQWATELANFIKKNGPDALGK